MRVATSTTTRRGGAARPAPAARGVDRAVPLVCLTVLLAIVDPFAMLSPTLRIIDAATAKSIVAGSQSGHCNSMPAFFTSLAYLSFSVRKYA